VEASDILIADLKKLLAVLKDKAKKYKDTIASPAPTAFTRADDLRLKLAVWYDETKRNLERMEQAAKSCASENSPRRRDLRQYRSVRRRICLPAVELKTGQYRDPDHSTRYPLPIRHDRGLIGSSLNKFATEIRLLQKTEVLEVEEPFFKGQIGSSAMPHKRIRSLANAFPGYPAYCGPMPRPRLKISASGMNATSAILPSSVSLSRTAPRPWIICCRNSFRSSKACWFIRKYDQQP